MKNMALTAARCRARGYLIFLQDNGSYDVDSCNIRRGEDHRHNLAALSGLRSNCTQHSAILQRDWRLRKAKLYMHWSKETKEIIDVEPRGYSKLVAQLEPHRRLEKSVYLHTSMGLSKQYHRSFLNASHHAALSLSLSLTAYQFSSHTNFHHTVHNITGE